MAERTEGLNLVLLGKVGAGKSASGNTILGREAFQSKKSPTSVTQDVTVESGIVCGRQVTVYDTPGLFNTKLSEQEIRQIYADVLQRCESGLCAFLLVIKPDRFTDKERETVAKIEELLGEERLKKTWILFTGGDELEDGNKSIDEFVNETEALKRLVQKYDQRYHVFNNKPKGQVQELLTKIYSTYPDTIEKGAKPKCTLVESLDPESPGQQHHMSEMTKRTSLTEMTRMRSRWRRIMGLKMFGSFRVSASRRIVLLGKTGVGKSAAKNTIQGHIVGITFSSTKTGTCEVSSVYSSDSGRSVSIVDTPGLFDTQMKPEQLMTETAKSVCLSSPGPHAFLIVLRVIDRFTDQEQQILQQIEMMFGEEVFKYSIILFTHGDLLRGESVEKLIEENSRLRDLVQRCGGRFHVFNNRDMKNGDQVNDLLKKIDTMVEQNGGGHYSYQMLEDAWRLRREEEKKHQEKKLRQEDTQIKYTKERIRAEFEGPPRFLQERLKAMRVREEEKKFEREWRPNRGFFGGVFSQMEKQEEQRREEIEKVIEQTERRIREEFEGPPRFLLERFKLMRQREEAEKTHREEIERVRKETEERVRAEFEGPPRVLLEIFESMRLSEEEEKTQREEIETEEKIRAEFEGPPRFLQERLKTIRLSMEDRIQKHVERQEELERRVREEEEMRIMEELREEMQEMGPMHISHMMKMRRIEEMRRMEMRRMEEIREEMEEMRHMEEMREEMEEMRHIEEMTEEMEEMRHIEEMTEEMEEMRCMEMRQMEKMRRMEMRQMEKMRRMEKMREEMEEMRRMEEMREDMEEMRHIEEMREEMEEMREEMEEIRYLVGMREMGPMQISRMMRHMGMIHMEVIRMEMRCMGMRRMEMQTQLQEEIDRVIKEMEENIRAEFKCPPR